MHTDSKYEIAFLTPSPTDVIMETPSPVDNISIDMPDSKSTFGNSNESEQVREKFLSMISENGNTSVPNSNTAFSDLTQEVIKTESGDSQVLEEVGSCQSIENVAAVGSDRISSVDYSHTNDKAKVELPNLVLDTTVPLDKVINIDTLGSPKDSSDRSESRHSKKISKSVISENKEIVIVSSSDNSCDIEYILSRNIHNTSKAPEVKEGKDNYDSVGSSLLHNLQDKTKGVELQSGNVSKIASIKPILSNSKNNESRKMEEKNHCLKTEFTCNLDIGSHRSFGQVVNFRKLNKTRGTQTQSDGQNLESASQKEIGMTESETEDSEFSQMEMFISKRESYLEIDGKYLKSLVNSKKSPNKIKVDGKLKKMENQKSEDDCTVSEGDQSVYEESREVWSGSDSKIKNGLESEIEQENFQMVDRKEILSEDSPLKNSEKKQRHSILLQGSLDSIDVRKPNTDQTFESMAKKSRSLEYIKNHSLTFKTPLSYCSSEIVFEPQRPKSESTIQLVTGNNCDEQTDDFCSECYLANDPSSTEIFYTIRSNCSSPLEDSTECDICSSCNLPNSADVVELKVQLPKSQSVCEVCEICGEPATDFEDDVVASCRQENTEVIDRRVTGLKSLHLSLPKTSFESDEEMLSSNQTTLEEERFEIENCGLQGEKGVLSEEEIQMSETEETLHSVIVESQEFKAETEVHVSKEIMDLQGSGFFVPKDEVVMLAENVKRLSRKSSFVKKGTSDRQDKRRYSSADNLPHKLFHRGNDRFFKSKDTKLVASTDSIRPMRHFRSKSLRRSSDSIGRYDSSNDNLDRLDESVDVDEEGTKEVTGPEEPRRKDSDSLESILLKHGIKLISQKETVL